MHALGNCHAVRKDFEQVKFWYTQAGLPKSFFCIGNLNDMGLGARLPGGGGLVQACGRGRVRRWGQ
jgi:hypothetical protein